MKQVISIVVPCYNEEEALPVTAKKIEEKITALKKNDKFKCITDYSVYYVDDGSQDGTWNLIQQLNEENKLFCGIKLSRNKGHQNALLAGLVTAKETSSAVISMDADLQDDIDAIDEMLDKYLAGVDVVYGVRSSRATDTFF